MNDQQAEAVHAPIDRPLLVLAAAGAGKTRVLTARVQHMIERMGVPADEVVALTFTRKAAGEMRRRSETKAEISTFHSLSLKIIRRHPDLVGLTSELKVTSSDPVATGSHAPSIDAWRNQGLAEAPPDAHPLAAQTYARVRQACRKQNCVPVADLVVTALTILRRGARLPWRYVLVDEFQDTNAAQFELVMRLSHGGRYLTVVGDDFQAIHGWRGARVHNIMDFCKTVASHQPACVKLETNYRSRPHILEAASAVIAHNPMQCQKRLIAAQPELEGSSTSIEFVACNTVDDEATAIANIVQASPFNTVAVLFRTNAATQPVERELRSRGIRYSVKGDYRFFARKEVRDALSYLRIVNGSHDNGDVKRALQIPCRGVGPASIAKIEAFGAVGGTNDLMDALLPALEACVVPANSKVAAGFWAFLECVTDLRGIDTHARVIQAVCDMLCADEPDVERQENLSQLARVTYASLSELLADADAEGGDGEDGGGLPDVEAHLTLSTMHASKGLEFDHVIMTGMAHGVFPCIWKDTDMTEERRLCYVGITRAKERLTLTSPRPRPSRFVHEMG